MIPGSLFPSNLKASVPWSTVCHHGYVFNLKLNAAFGHPSDILHLDLCFDIQVFLSFVTECDVWNQNRLKIIPEGNESIMQCWILSKYAFPKPFGEGIAFLRGLGSKKNGSSGKWNCSW